MPTAGTVQFVLTMVHLDIDAVGASINVTGNATKYIVDDLGSQRAIDTFQGIVTYPLVGAGTRTLASIKADLITAIQAANMATSGKTIS